MNKSWKRPRKRSVGGKRSVREKEMWNVHKTNKRYLNSPVIRVWKIKQWIGIFFTKLAKVKITD